jgi:hypothetical protein
MRWVELLYMSSSGWWLICSYTWQVTFHEPKLGLNLRRVDGVGAVVDSKSKPAAAAPATPQADSGSRSLAIDTGAAGQEVAPFVGDVVVSVGGEACDGDHTKVRPQPALYATFGPFT